MADTNWQSINSAPRDGTRILLCRALDGKNRPIDAESWNVFIQVAAWWTNDDGSEGEWIVYCSIPNDPPLHFVPTHWMPLPGNPLWTVTYHDGGYAT